MVNVHYGSSAVIFAVYQVVPLCALSALVSSRAVGDNRLNCSAPFEQHDIMPGGWQDANSARRAGRMPTLMPGGRQDANTMLGERQDANMMPGGRQDTSFYPGG